MHTRTQRQPTTLSQYRQSTASYQASCASLCRSATSQCFWPVAAAEVVFVNVKEKLKPVCLFPAPSLATLSSSIPKFGHQMRCPPDSPPLLSYDVMDGLLKLLLFSLLLPVLIHVVCVCHEKIPVNKKNQIKIWNHLQRFFYIFWAPTRFGSQGGDRVVLFINQLLHQPKEKQL